MDSSLATTLPGAVRHAAAHYARRPAVLTADGTWLTYGELTAQILAAAAAYVHAGVEPGDRVCVWAPNSPEWIVAALGAQYAGAVLVPLNTRYRGEAADLVTRTRARALVVHQGFLGTDHLALLGPALSGLPRPPVIVTLGAPAPGAVPWAAFLAAATPPDAARAEAYADAVTPGTLADILFTSGTTGRAKGAMAAHAQTLEVASRWAELAGVTGDDRYLIVNPFFHSFGSKAGFLVCLLRGAACIPVPVFDATEVLRLASQEKATILPGPPALYQSLLDHPHAADGLAAVRLAVTGAAIVPEILVQRMGTDLGIGCVLTAYGLTEAPVVTMCTPGDDVPTIASTCGRAVPGMEVRIAGADGRPAPAGTAGQVLVRGRQVMLGYLDDPGATAEAIDSDGWLHTGDIGVLSEQGLLRITDRLGDMFTVGGFNVYPAEVERVLSTHPAVRESAVIGVPDARLGHVPLAYVTPRAGHAVDAAELIAHCRERIANYKVPRTVVAISELPRNAGGKVVKPDLRRLAAERP